MEDERYHATIEWDKQFEATKWVDKIPYIKFPNEWEIQVCPPFRSAVVRFRVKSGKADLSIYLDCYDMIGYFGEPYWELYPHSEDVFRCKMEDTESLIKAIQESIEAANKTTDA